MNILDTLFGPVSKKYCSLFYYLSVWSFVLYIVAVIVMLAWGISHNKDFFYYITSVAISIVYLLVYFQNRLLFSMCSR